MFSIAYDCCGVGLIVAFEKKLHMRENSFRASNVQGTVNKILRLAFFRLSIAAQNAKVLYVSCFLNIFPFRPVRTVVKVG